MGLSLDIQEVLGDVARSNLFEIEIPFLGETFKFHAKASSIPEDTVNKLELSYQNRKLGIAGDRVYADWNVTVYNDADHKVRKQFIDWSELVQSHGRDLQGERPEGYKKEAFVKQYDRDGETITTNIKISGIWPTTIAALELDWENDALEVFDVTFSVDYVEELSV